MANPGNLPSSGTLSSYSGSAATRWSSPKHKTGPKPGVVVYEFWLKENERVKPSSEAKTESMEEAEVKVRWRVVVTAANVVLMDEYAEDLWSGANHPYERYVWDDTDEFYGIALVDHLAYPQIYINRLLTALQHNAELTGNPIFIEPANSGLNRVNIINRPGQRVRLSGPGGDAEQAGMDGAAIYAGFGQNLVTFWIEPDGSTLPV
jgi:hypothetical protein